MGTTVLLTLIGFIVIVVDKGGEPLKIENVKLNSHPAFGLIVLLTALIQPLMAAFRPSPAHAKRWLFNLAHWGLGNVAFFFAILAIFFGMEYHDVNMPKSVVYVLITYVIVHFMVHFLLTFQQFYIKCYGSNRHVAHIQLKLCRKVSCLFTVQINNNFCLHFLKNAAVCLHCG